MNLRSLVILFLLLLSYSCKVDLNGKVTTGATTREFVLGGNCEVFNSSLDAMVCVEYDDYYHSESQMDANCDTLTTLYNAEGATGITFYYGDFDACPSSNRVGKCIHSKNRIYYYSSEFGAGSAESDCLSLNGVFSTN